MQTSLELAAASLVPATVHDNRAAEKTMTILVYPYVFIYICVYLSTCDKYQYYNDVTTITHKKKQGYMQLVGSLHLAPTQMETCRGPQRKHQQAWPPSRALPRTRLIYTGGTPAPAYSNSALARIPSSSPAATDTFYHFLSLPRRLASSFSVLHGKGKPSMRA